MNRNKTLIILIALLFLNINTQNDILACTITKITKSGTTIIGNNEDGMSGTTYLWFLPASKGKYGRVYFTLDNKWPQGGMNDQGLFYDGTSGSLKDIVKSLDKPEYPGNLSEKMLEECSNVFEAIEFLQQYNLSYFRNGQMFLADKFGNSAIVEGDTIIYSDKDYQIATNYYLSNPSLGGYPCHRYDIAEAIAQNMSSISMNAMSFIMQAVHLDGYSFTQYSTIHDLQNLKIHYYKDSDFSKYVEIDLTAELLKGERWFETKQFFEKNTQFERKIKNDLLKLPKSLKSFYENGSIKCNLFFSQNILNGDCTAYYNNGNLAWQTSYYNGKIKGLLHYLNISGGKIISYDFLSENKVYLNDYYSDGVLKRRVTLKKIGEDRIVTAGIAEYNKSGRWKFTGTFKNAYLSIRYMITRLMQKK